MIRVLIVDDEPLARGRLSSLLAELPDNKLLGVASNGAEGLKLCRQLAPDLLLLDVRMPGVDGVTLAQQLDELAEKPLIIFTTAYEQYALDAFGVDAVDYLLKPINKDKLATSLSKAQQRLQSAAETAEEITIKQGNELLRVSLDDICYLKSDHKYTTVMTSDREYLTETPLAKFAEAYPEQLIRVHRNALANRKRLASLRHNSNDGWLLQLTGVEQPLQVSRRQLSALKQAVGNPKLS